MLEGLRKFFRILKDGETAAPVKPEAADESGLRVLHAPVNIGNQPWHLSRAERRLGCRSDLIVNYGTWLQIPADEILSSAYGDASDETKARRKAFCERAPRDYDVLHYYFGRTSACWDDYGPRDESWYSDLRAAKANGKRVFMTLQGCDARLAGESNRRNAFTPCAEGRCSAYSACRSTYDTERQWLIDTILPLCDRVFYLNPELGHFVPNGTFMPYASVDWKAFEPVAPRTSGTIRIVHGPSDPRIKGTDLILPALEALRDRFDFELVTVSGKPHHEAIEIYKQADIAIDQVLAGWYGGFAVELMALGKPVMCHIREDDMRFLHPAFHAALPIRNIRPDHLEQDIGDVLARRSEWGEWSAQGLDFVRNWHDPDRIAQAMVGCYRSPDAHFALFDDAPVPARPAVTAG